ILRNHASLRMVGSSKINGYPLIFDNPTHKLTDSLIRIYFKNRRLTEQTITINNLSSRAKKIIKKYDNNNDSDIHSQFLSTNKIIVRNNLSNYVFKSKSNDITYSSEIYEAAFNLFNNLQPNIFKMGKIKGEFI